MFDEKPDVEQIDAVEPLLHGLTMPSRRPIVPDHQKCGKNFTGSFKELCKKCPPLHLPQKPQPRGSSQRATQSREAKES